MRLKYSYPRSPKTNANVERVIRTIEEDLWFIEGLDFYTKEMNNTKTDIK
ncbi:hypothetical protein OOJ74_04940 [Venenivibrio stagnispumantis]|nr:hypothetical protein [Venenivibrio stagnispumantis]MCW4573349.1 hypothetical protein [Venenivibrio stagnispumantis]